MEETGNVGHHTAFVWMGRVAEIFNFEELRDVEVFSSDLEGEASVAMSVALGICEQERRNEREKAILCQVSHNPRDQVDDSG